MNRGDFRMWARVQGVILSSLTSQGQVRFLTSASFIFLTVQNYEKQCLFYDRICKNLLAEIFFLIAFCNVYSLFFPYHFHILNYRWWDIDRWLQWQFSIFFCHPLSCYFKIILFSCHLPSHLNFNLFPCFSAPFLEESIYEKSFQIHSMWNFFRIEKLLGCFGHSPPLPEQTVCGQESRQEHILL